MRIAVIGAMPEEIAALKGQMRKRTHHRIGHHFYWRGLLHRHVVYLMQAGIGKVTSAVNTALFIQAVKPDYVIHTGSAGALKSDLKIGDIIIADQLSYYDVDVTAFDYAHGQVPKMPAFYYSDKRLLRLAMREGDRSKGRKTKVGMILSGDSFIASVKFKRAIAKRFPKALALDMESTAVAQTCYLLKKPFIVVRSISDQADDTANKVHDRFLKMAAENALAMVEYIVSHLST